MVRNTIVTLVAIVSLANVVSAASPCNPCNASANYVEKTVMCPTWVTEMRTVCETKYRNEERAKQCTVYEKMNVEKKMLPIRARNFRPSPWM
jgi:hypothetical protein